MAKYFNHGVSNNFGKMSSTAHSGREKLAFTTYFRHQRNTDVTDLKNKGSENRNIKLVENTEFMVRYVISWVENTDPCSRFQGSMDLWKSFAGDKIPRAWWLFVVFVYTVYYYKKCFVTSHDVQETH